METKWEPTFPLIFGGDFNLSASEERLKFIKNYDYSSLGISEKRNPMILPYCFENSSCKVENDAMPLKKFTDIREWQGFNSGNGVKIEPKRVRYMFKDPDPRGFKIRGKKKLI